MISKLKPLTWSWEQQDNFQDEVPQLTWIVLKDDYPTCWNKAENWDRPFTCCQKQNQHFELIKQTLRSVTEHKDTWFNLNRLHKAMSGGNYYFSRSPVIRENEVTTTYSSRQCVCIVCEWDIIKVAESKVTKLFVMKFNTFATRPWPHRFERYAIGFTPVALSLDSRTWNHCSESVLLHWGILPY